MVIPSLPSEVLDRWLDGDFILLTCDEQIDEIRRVTRYARVKARIVPALAGRFVNELRKSAVRLIDLPQIEVCRDPWDNYLLALVAKGEADFLVTGDKADLLALERFGRTRIVTARRFLERS